MTDNELENLKQEWQQISVKVDRLQQTNKKLSQQLADNNIKPLQYRLAGRIRRVAYSGILLPVLAPLLYFKIESPLWVCIVYAVFGLLMMVIDLCFVDFILRDNLVEMPVVDAIRRASDIKIRQQRLIALGSTLGVAVIATLLLTLPTDNQTPIIVGAIIGLLIGLSFSIPRAVTNVRIARRLLKSVQDLQ